MRPEAAPVCAHRRRLIRHSYGHPPDGSQRSGRDDSCDRHECAPSGSTSNNNNKSNNAAVTTMNEMRAAIGRFVEHEATQNFLVVLLVVNAITLGIATTDLGADGAVLHRYFDILDHTILVIFTAEVVLQIIYRGPFHLTTWNWFDLLVVAASWVVEVLVLRAVRILRIFTLSSRLRFIQDLLEALVDVAPRLAGILALLLLVLYVYAVLCTTLFPASPYFARLDRAVFTLFQLMTLEDWTTVLEETATHEANWWIFSTFMVMTSFILYSLITACVCMAVAEVSFVDADCQRALAAVETRLRELQRRQAWILQQARNIVQHEADRTIPTTHRRRRQETIIEIRQSTFHHRHHHHHIDDDDDVDSSAFSSYRRRWQTVRSNCRKLLRHDLTQWAMITLIILNAAVMGAATFDIVTESSMVTSYFDWIDRGFLIVFTIEMAVQLIGHDTAQPYDGWLLFDGIIIVLSWSLETMQIARAVRILRVVRLSARLDTLRQLWSALAEVAPSVSYIMGGLVLVLYIFAVLCTVLFSDLHEMGVTSQDYFGSLDRSMFTLFQIITMEEWSSIVRELATEYYWAWWIFIPFIILTTFVLKSLVVAVICDVVQSRQHLSEVEVQKKVRRLEIQVEGMVLRQQEMLEMLMRASMILHHPDNNNNDGLSSASSWSSWSGHLVLDDTVAKVHVDHKQKIGKKSSSGQSSSVLSLVRKSLFRK